jgi:retinol dehydrogenase-12
MKAQGSKVTCNAVHPGCVNTEVTRNMSPVMRFLDYLGSPLLLMLRKTPAEGAYTSIHVATAVELEGIGGEYFFHCRPSIMNECAKDPVAAEKLWILSERLTGLIGECDKLQPKQS